MKAPFAPWRSTSSFVHFGQGLPVALGRLAYRFDERHVLASKPLQHAAGFGELLGEAHVPRTQGGLPAQLACGHLIQLGFESSGVRSGDDVGERRGERTVDQSAARCRRDGLLLLEQVAALEEQRDGRSVGAGTTDAGALQLANQRRLGESRGGFVLSPLAAMPATASSCSSFRGGSAASSSAVPSCCAAAVVSSSAT